MTVLGLFTASSFFAFTVKRAFAMSSQVLTIRVGAELKSKLDRLGKILHRSKSYIAQQAISQYVEENVWQIEELSQAEKEIGQGEFVNNDEMNRYLDSWGSTSERKAPKT